MKRQVWYWYCYFVTTILGAALLTSRTFTSDLQKEKVVINMYFVNRKNLCYLLQYQELNKAIPNSLDELEVVVHNTTQHVMETYEKQIRYLSLKGAQTLADCVVLQIMESINLDGLSVGPYTTLHKQLARYSEMREELNQMNIVSCQVHCIWKTKNISGQTVKVYYSRICRHTVHETVWNNIPLECAWNSTNDWNQIEEWKVSINFMGHCVTCIVDTTVACTHNLIGMAIGIVLEVKQWNCVWL